MNTSRTTYHIPCEGREEGEREGGGCLGYEHIQTCMYVCIGYEVYERHVGMSTSVVSCIQLYMHTCVGHENCVYFPQCSYLLLSGRALQLSARGINPIARHFFSVVKA